LLASIDRAIDLSTKTLAFVREGAPTLNRTRFRLRDLIDEVGSVLPPAQNDAALWHNDVPAEIELQGDRDQLFRVFANLGQNAVQAGASEVTIKAEQENGLATIRVGDNGPGLPPRARDKLFQPFSGSARPGGTGLGLAIARDLLRAHGGDIRLEASTAAGTVFELRLPS
jgi:signal transduction histidine kinase